MVSILSQIDGVGRTIRANGGLTDATTLLKKRTCIDFQQITRKAFVLCEVFGGLFPEPFGKDF